MHMHHALICYVVHLFHQIFFWQGSTFDSMSPHFTLLSMAQSELLQISGLPFPPPYGTVTIIMTVEIREQ